MARSNEEKKKKGTYRKESDATANTLKTDSIPEPSVRLTAKQRLSYNQVCQFLIDHEVICEVDNFVITHCVILQSLADELGVKMRQRKHRVKSSDKGEAQTPDVTTYFKALQEWRQLQAEIGLSPKARKMIRDLFNIPDGQKEKDSPLAKISQLQKAS